ncbi:MAG TPA: adenylate/guanylate cyclase domain-containing protein [Tepidisphaeraceae bacterium]
MRLPLKLSPQGPGRKTVAAALIALAATGLALAARYGPGVSLALSKLDYLLYDSLYHLRPVQDQTNGPVVIVGVDDKSLDALSHNGIGKTTYGWPWPREFWGMMVDYFGRCGARAVAFDLIFTEPSPYNASSDDDGAFAKHVEKSRIPVILGSRFMSDGKPERFAPPVKDPQFGAVNVGNDVVYRWYEPVVNGAQSLAARAAADVGAVPITQPFLLHYYGPYQTSQGKRTFHYLSAANVLAASVGQKNTGITREMFRGKTVLVGAITVGTYDLKSSPLSAEYPGVEVQATAMVNMLEGQRVRQIAVSWAIAAAFLTSLAAALGVAFPRRVGLKLALAAVVLAALIGTAAALFVGHQIRWLPLAAPLLAFLLATVGAFAWSYLAEGRQRRLVLKALSQYVSPQVAAEIDRDPGALKLGGERREMSVMFTDIQGFTDLSERLDEHTLTKLLNYYLDEMSSLVFANNGTLDKYIGDAIMSFWNAPLHQPDHALLACRAALAMERREREIQPQLNELGATGLLTRIGINTGPMVFGNMGSSQKFNYSVLGDAVNLASRLEGANKFYGSRILIAQPTADQVKGQFLLRQVDLLRVKGKLKPMAVYDLLAELNGAPDADLLFRKTEYEAAFAHYQQQQWSDATERLSTLRERFPGDGPAAALIQRVAYLSEHSPGPDWDGVYVAKGK